MTINDEDVERFRMLQEEYYRKRISFADAKALYLELLRPYGTPVDSPPAEGEHPE